MKTITKRCGLAAFGTLLGALLLTLLAGCNTLESIDIRPPNKTILGQGQELDTSGLMITANYKKNSETVSGTGGLQISGYDKSRPGVQTVTVTMHAQDGLVNSEASNTFTVTVIPVENISISQVGTTSFKQGDAANWGALSIRVSFANNAVPPEIVTSKNGALAIGGYDKDKAGEQRITVNYYRKQASFNVTVMGLESIAVTSLPLKTEYYTGEELDLSGLAVQGLWSDGSRANVNITKDNLSGYDITRGGKQDVLVSYSGKTTSFPVTYLAFEAVSIDRLPTKTAYELGEDLDMAGLRVLGTWPGHSLAIVNNSRLRITGYDPLRAGEQRITVTVGGQSDIFIVHVTNPFEGLWRGEWKAGRTRIDDKMQDVIMLVTLRLEGSAWTLRTKELVGGELEEVELRGVYIPDSNTHAKFECDDYQGRGDINRDSSRVMRLKIGLIGGEITLDRMR
ncbi:MAG: bacterial Ig-like domain-containing protein [Spirochaetaceae bacterium]|jgi:hypothetical protein|nr:bacterial Ig-like domain-containing protein [Spirochaetaceae bacterium]